MKAAPSEAADRGVSRAEWTGAVLGGLLFAAVCLAPYLYGYALSNEDVTFSGLLPPLDDHLFHLSWARQAQAGHLLFESKHVGAGPEGERLFNLLFLTMGLAARLLGTSVVMGFHVVRTLAAAAFVPAVYWFAAPLIRPARWRAVAALLATLSAGLGWLTPLIGGRPADLFYIETSDFWTFRWEAVVGPSTVLMVVALGLVDRALRRPAWRRFVWAGLAAAGVAAVHTQDLFIVLAAAWLAGLFSAISHHEVSPQRRPAGRKTGSDPNEKTSRGLTPSFRPPAGLVLVTLLAAPIAVYNLAAALTDPAYLSYALIAHDIGLASVALGYGLVLVLAAVGAVATRRRRESAALVPLAWVLVAAAGLAVPWPRGQRVFLLDGLHVPLCLLAAYGMKFLLGGRRPVGLKPHPSPGAGENGVRPQRKDIKGSDPIFARAGVRGALVALSIALTMPTNVMRYVAEFRDLPSLRAEAGTEGAVEKDAVFLPRDFLAAADWLAQNARPRDLVLADIPAAEWLAVHSGTRIFAGHPKMAADYATRQDLLTRFFVDDAGKTAAELRPVLAQSGARYVLFSPDAGQPGSPLTRALLERERLAEPAFQAGRFVVYRVVNQS